MSDVDRGQVAIAAAEVYESFFVPALFGQFAPVVCDAALVDEGQRVVDVACGTGVLAREAADRVGPTGQVVGVDVNDGMLAVARRLRPEVDWRPAPAEDLPLDEGSVDAALCQFGLMFFDDRTAALRELGRVVRPGGRLAVATWSGLERTPGYAALSQLLGELFGDQAARSLEAPFVIGTEELLRAELDAAGLHDATIVERPGTARFPSYEAWLTTEIRGWTLADSIDDDQFAELLDVGRSRLATFVTGSGAVELAAPALVASVVV